MNRTARKSRRLAVWIGCVTLSYFATMAVLIAASAVAAQR